MLRIEKPEKSFHASKIKKQKEKPERLNFTYESTKAQ